MRCIVNRPDYSYTYAFDANGAILDGGNAYIQGDVPNNWSLDFRNDIRRIQFSKKQNLTIGEYAFFNCGLLSDLVIPDNVSSIGRDAFSQANGINNVFVNLNETALGGDVFLDGPTGSLYVTQEYISTYGGLGATYDGMYVELWSAYPQPIATITDLQLPVYNMSVSSAVDEGDSLLVNVSTQNVDDGTYYWTILTDGFTAEDADFININGNFILSNGQGSFNIQTKGQQDSDTPPGGQETFRIQLRLDSVAGDVVSTSQTITIIDLTPTYVISSSTSINEGDTLAVTVNTTNVADSTTLYWRIGHIGTNSSDFQADSGSFTITSDVGNFNIISLVDGSTESSETFDIDVATDVNFTNIVDTSSTITLNNVAAPPTYSISTASSVDEGSLLQVNVTTTNVGNATLYWTINHGTTEAADFIANSGSFSVTNDSGSFNIQPDADGSSESAETFQVEIRTGSIGGPVVDTSSNITVNNVNNPPSYTATPQSLSVDEGSSLTIDVVTANVSDGTTLYWTVKTGGALTAANADFSATSGNFQINTNNGSFNVNPISDALVEGNETFQVEIRTGSISGTIVDVTDTITIVDKTPTYSVSSAATVDEGTNLSVTVNTTNVANGTFLYWTILTAGYSADQIDFSPTNGSFEIQSDSGSFNVSPQLDAAIEGDEIFKIEIRTGSTSGTVVETSDVITIKDKTPTYSITPQFSSIDEGDSLLFIVDTTNVSNGTTLYWKINNATSESADFTATDGNFTVNSDQGNFSITTVSDVDSDAETFTVSITTDAGLTNVVATSGEITINDGPLDWSQLGNDIDGVNSSEEFGISVSYSENTTDKYVVIGAHKKSSYTGRAEGRKYNSGTNAWDSLGDVDTGVAVNDQCGYSVALVTVDGQNPRAAISNIDRDNGGSFDEGSFRVSDFNGSSWNDQGSEVFGGTAKIYLGYSISISSDGTVVAMGAPCRNDREVRSNSLAGEVQVYSWNGSAWNAKGAAIVGEASNDEFGWSVAISSDGNTIAVGAPVNDGNGADSGHVRVYDWNSGGGTWDQRGADIDGAAAGDKSGYSVSLSDDGNTVAIGSPEHNSGAGHVRIYDWNSGGGTWDQRGTDIDGVAASDNSGWSVCLSSDGNKVAIGSPQHSSGAGLVRVYSWSGSAWQQHGSDIDGAAGDSFGWSVSLSDDGSILAAGSPTNSSNIGRVRVYEFV